MTDLSPAAQAVRQAAINAKPGHTIAVALRAAAIELRKAYVNDLDFHSADQWLDALAAELENTSPSEKDQ